jgi:outer membrane protein
MKINEYFVVLVLLLLSTIGYAQDLLKIEDAFAIALENNFDIQIATNEKNISKNNVHIGNANLLPQVDIISNANYQDNSLKTEAGTVNDASTQTSAKLQASYTVFDGFNNIYSFQRLKTFGEIGELQARSSIEFTLLRISNAYYAVASATENFKIATEALTISQQRFERAKRRNQYGQANTIDVLSAQVDLNADSVSFFNAKLRMDEMKRELNVLLNREVSTDFEVDSGVVFLNQFSLADLRVNAVENNALYLLSIQNVQKSQLDLKLANSNFYPRISLSGSYGYNQNEPDLGIRLDDPNKSFTAGLILSLNLFNGFKNSIQRQNAKIQIKSQELLKEQTKLDLEKEVENIYDAYQNSRSVLEIQQRNLRSAELNFTRTQELYDLGQATTTTFREAQLNLIRAKNNIANAKYDAKLLEFELLQLSGLLITRNE